MKSVKADQVQIKSLITKGVELSDVSRCLAAWLTLKDKEYKTESEASRVVEVRVAELEHALRKARSKAPGKAQWSQLRDIAVRAESMQDIREALFEQGVRPMLAWDLEGKVARRTSIPRPLRAW